MRMKLSWRGGRREGVYLDGGRRTTQLMRDSLGRTPLLVNAMPQRKPRSLTLGLSATWYRTLWRLFRSRVLHGIRAAVWPAATDRERCFDRVDEALDIIERFDPSTLARMRRQFAGILVFGEERFRNAYWSNPSRICVITGRYLESPDVSSERLALTLVHENMHATLCAAGSQYDDGRRARIEVLCAMAELAFARRLPDHKELVERTERRIEDWATAGEVMWSNATQREEKLEQLRELGTPKWLVVLLDHVSRLFSRRAA